jgi:tripartite-type tricarboxylate transporter receptor subunit TctC
MKLHRLPGLLAGAAASLVLGTAAAYPDKPIQYVVPFAPGGESDLTARLQAEVFAKKYKQQMVVINRPGAGGGLVWGQLNGMPSDGHTVAGINLPHIVLQPLEGNVQYKTADMNPVYFFQYTADIVVVGESSPFRTFQDLVKAAKAAPGKVTLAGAGMFSGNHMALERLNKLAGIKATYVPYNSTNDLLNPVMGGHVGGAMTYLPVAIQQKGKIRMLAVASEKRHPALPEVPTFKELGLDWVDGTFRGVAVPKSTPRDLQKKVSDLMYELNQDEAMRKKMSDLGYDLVDVTLEKMPAFLAERSKVSLEDAKAAGLLK